MSPGETPDERDDDEDKDVGGDPARPCVIGEARWVPVRDPPGDQYCEPDLDGKVEAEGERTGSSPAQRTASARSQERVVSTSSVAGPLIVLSVFSTST